ncbi:MAG: methyl-accepting chemotaxis protein [Planctomycetia bacterium]|nr:methyl-accepting chemotaxis protein [Planctomycetia bacterium]
MIQHWRLRTKIGIVIGVLALTALGIAGVGVHQLGAVNDQLQHLVAVTAHEIELGQRMRVGLLEAIRAEKNAIMSTRDEESRQFADDAAKAAESVNRSRQELTHLLETHSTPEIRSALADFARSWDEFQRIEKQVLGLAVQNTNVKATALSNGTGYDKAQAIGDAMNAVQTLLDKDVTDAAAKDAARLGAAYKKARLAGAVQALVLKMDQGLDLHINAVTEEDLSRYEVQFRALEKDVDTKLAQLAEEADARERALIDKAAAQFAAFKETSAQVLKLSRVNSNIRSAQLAAGEGRTAAIACDAALVRLMDELAKKMNADKTASQASYAFAKWLIVIVTVVGLSISIVLALTVTRSITGPLAQSAALAEAIAHGDLTRRLNIMQRDEVGQLASAADNVAATLARVVAEIRDGSRRIGGSAGELVGVSHELLAQSEEMATQAGVVAGATTQMSNNISTMAAASEQMSMNVASISSASEEISVNVGTISTAARGASHNVRAVVQAVAGITQAFAEISDSARKSSHTTAQATDMAARATATMNLLDRAAGEITKVTEVIKMIALQTNLLALNATIEATAAGDAGKGFAVVANEVKELAQQSGKAAEDIARKIEEVQRGTREAVSAIHEVAQIIGAIHGSAGRISEAVEQQSQSAHRIRANVDEASRGVDEIAGSIAEVAKGATDMARNAAEAAKGANDVSRHAAEAAKGTQAVAVNIQGVSQATKDNTASAQQVNGAANGLTTIAGELQKIVGQFKIEG